MITTFICFIGGLVFGYLILGPVTLWLLNKYYLK